MLHLIAAWQASQYNNGIFFGPQKSPLYPPPSCDWIWLTGRSSGCCLEAVAAKKKKSLSALRRSAYPPPPKLDIDTGATPTLLASPPAQTQTTNPDFILLVLLGIFII